MKAVNFDNLKNDMNVIVEKMETFQKANTQAKGVFIEEKLRKDKKEQYVKMERLRDEIKAKLDEAEKKIKSSRFTTKCCIHLWWHVLLKV